MNDMQLLGAGLKREDNPNELVEFNRVKVGYELLGPVIHAFLHKLHAYMQFFDDGRTVNLFCARAGVRMYALYQVFVQRSGAREVRNADILWISRFLACKGLYRNSPDAILDLVASEFRHVQQADVVRALLRHRPDLLKKVEPALRVLTDDGGSFVGALEQNSGWQDVLKTYLNEVSRDFNLAFKKLIGQAERVVIIDTGWQGSTQCLLAAAYPELEFKGLYFGRTFMGRQSQRYVPDIVGVMFECDSFNQQIPESAFVLHRHLIEALFEPNGPSVEEVVLPGQVGARLAEGNLQEVVNEEKDAHFIGVRRYIADHASTATPAQIMARHESAMRKLAEMIATPTLADAFKLDTKPRSSDFGRSRMVPVLVDPQGKHASLSTRQRVEQSLWPQGQLALEYSPEQAREAQLQSLGLTSAADFFDTKRAASGVFSEDHVPSEITLADAWPGSVAIVTRTKNRPILLARAAKSIARQTHRNVRWVVVNDGGSEKPVVDIIRDCLIEPRHITLISSAASVGMEAASNLGIRAVDTEFVVIHDDDDSWDPSFLERTIAFLSSPGGAKYGGVITKSLYVSEEIRGDTVVEHERRPYQDWVRNIQLPELATSNFFPPIAFLFRRAIYKKLGGFNERLPVLGDWDFNIRFVAQSDIGVLPEALAYYHHRDRGESGSYSNSVIGGISKHEEFNSIMRNAHIRQASPEHAAAISVALGYILSEIRYQLGALGSRISDSSIATGHAAGGAAAHAQEMGLKAKLKPALDRADLVWILNHLPKPAESRKLGFWARMLPSPPSVVEEPPQLQDGLFAVAEYVRQKNIAIPPPDDFDSHAYLTQHQDVARGVEQGHFRTAFDHYIRYGRWEGRERG